MKTKLLRRIRRRFLLKFEKSEFLDKLYVYDLESKNLDVYEELTYKVIPLGTLIQDFIADKYWYGKYLVRYNQSNKNHRLNVAEARRLFGSI